jgi:hypothetical protein
LAIDEETAQAETANGLPLPPTAVYSARVELRFIADLTDGRIRKTLGTTIKELTSPLLYKSGDPPLPTHVLAKAIVMSRRFSAIRYPSARRRRGVCIAIFATILAPGEFLEVEDRSGIFSNESSAHQIGLLRKLTQSEEFNAT